VTAGYKTTDTITVDTMAAHGQRAAHGHIDPSDQGFATIDEKATFPALAHELWGRAYFYIPIPATDGHTLLVSASAGTKEQLEIGISTGNWQLTYYDAGGNEHPVGSMATYPRSKWTCLEWHFTTSGTNFIELYVDGALADSYPTQGKTVQALTTMSLGIQNHSANTPPDDVYIDDVAVDATRINCLH
jgi:hypothetical protein